MTMLQLNPMIPVYVPSKQQEGYAFVMIDESQEHPVAFGIAMNDTGEIWFLPNHEVRFCWNESLGRKPNAPVPDRKETSHEYIARINEFLTKIGGDHRKA